MRGKLACGLLAGALSLCGAMGVQAAIIGPAVDNTYTGVDTAGERVNVDESNPLVLDPGTYIATQFNFFATATSANTTPFLAINSDTTTPNPTADINSFSIIAAGATIPTAPIPVTNVPQTVPFGGTGATFTLTQTTKVFAGVASGSVSGADANSIGFKSGTQVDHNNPNPTQFTPTVGGTIPSFSNPNLARVYGFNINVVAAPEPTSLSLLGVAGLGLLRRRR